AAATIPVTRNSPPIVGVAALCWLSSRSFGERFESGSLNRVCSQAMTHGPSKTAKTKLNSAANAARKVIFVQPTTRVAQSAFGQSVASRSRIQSNMREGERGIPEGKNELSHVPLHLTTRCLCSLRRRGGLAAPALSLGSVAKHSPRG